MTKLLDEVIADIRTLPEQDQNWAAENMRRLMRERERGASYQLTPEQVEEVGRTLADLEAGRERLLTDEEMGAMWRRLGA